MGRAGTQNPVAGVWLPTLKASVLLSAWNSAVLVAGSVADFLPVKGLGQPRAKPARGTKEGVTLERVMGSLIRAYGF